MPAEMNMIPPPLDNDEWRLNHGSMKMCFAVSAVSAVVAGMDLLLRGLNVESSIVAGFCMVAGFYATLGLCYWWQNRRGSIRKRADDDNSETANARYDHRDAA